MEAFCKVMWIFERTMKIIHLTCGYINKTGFAYIHIEIIGYRIFIGYSLKCTETFKKAC